MHFLTQFIVSLSVIVAAGSLVGILLELQRLRRAMETRRLFSLNTHGLRASPSGGRGVAPAEAAAGFAIYVFREGRWHLEADLSAPGCEATPPTIEGRFEGQVVRQQATGRT